MKNGMHVDRWGEKIWYKNGNLHREDGPTVIYADGSKSWYKNGNLHREDGPAIEDASGAKFWFKNGTWYPSFDEWLEKMNFSDEDKLFLKLKWA